jgi:hypothetical protein
MDWEMKICNLGQEIFKHKGQYSIWDYISSHFQLLTLCSTSGRWTRMCACGGWGMLKQCRYGGKKMKYLEKNPNQSKFSHHKTHSHWLGIEQFPHIYNRSWSKNQYITIPFLNFLTPTHVAVITNTSTTSLFQSANTNMSMWSCTDANVRCYNGTKGKCPATHQRSVISHITAFWSQLVATKQISQQLK